MGVRVKKGTFTCNTTTGNQAITGVGFQPKAVIIWGVRATAAGFSGPTAFSFTHGIGTASTARWCTSIGADDAAASSNSARRLSTDAIIYIHANGNSTGTTTDAIADLVSLDSDGFTINWSDAPSSAWVLHYLCLGGASLTNAKAGTITIATTGTPQAFTDPGFQPDAVLFSGANAASAGAFAAGAAFSWGAATGTANEGSLAFSDRDGQATMVTLSEQDEASCVLAVATGSTARTVQANLASFDTNGFSLNVTTLPAASVIVPYLALKGGNYKLITETVKITTTGTKATTGAGFQPSGAIFASWNWQDAASYDASRSLVSLFGADGTTEGGTWFEFDDGVADSAIDQNHVTDKALLMANQPSTITSAADLQSFDSDGFTLNYTTVDATVRQFHVLLIGPPENNVTASPSGLAATSAQGTPVAKLNSAPSALAATSAQGTPTAKLNAAPAAIASTAAQGTPTVKTNVASAGLASTAAQGTAAVRPNVAVAGIASTEALGTTTVRPRPTLAGVASTAATGTPTLTPRPVVGPAGIASTAALGAPTVRANLGLNGIASASAAGALSAKVNARTYGIDPYESAIVNDGAIGYWRFREPNGLSIDLRDESGNGQVGATAGTLVGSDVAGPFGESRAYFKSASASNYAAYTPRSGSLANLGTDDMSFECWFRTTTHINWHNIVNHGWNGAAGVSGLALLGTLDGRLQFGIWGKDGGGVNQSQSLASYTVPGGYNDDVWRHLVGVYTGTQVLLYVNGELVASNGLGTNPTTIYTTQTRWNGAGADRAVAEPAAYPYALSAEQIRNHYRIAKELERFAPTTRPNVTTTGVASTAAVGAVTLGTNATVNLTGLAPTSAVGSPTVKVRLQAGGLAAEGGTGAVSGQLRVALSGIASTAATGSVNLGSNVLLSLSGLAATSSVGTVSLTLRVSAGGLPGEGVAGSPSTALSIGVSGLPESAALGAPWSKVNVTLAGIAGAAIAGVAATRPGTSPAGIGATSAVGSLATALNVGPAGVPPSSGVGSPNVAGQLALGITGIAPASATGAASARPRVSLAGVPASATVGVSTARTNLVPAGLVPTAAVGSLSDKLTVVLAGVASTADIGASEGRSAPTLDGIAPTSDVGTPEFVLYVSPEGVGSTVQFGLTLLRKPRVGGTSGGNGAYNPGQNGVREPSTQSSGVDEIQTSGYSDKNRSGGIRVL